MSQKKYASTRPPFLVLLSVLSIAGCAFGVFFSQQRARGYAQYHELKHELTNWDDLENMDTAALNERAERSIALAPENFMLCQHMADVAYHTRAQNDGLYWYDRISLSRVWVEQGLLLNPYERGLVHRKVDLLEKEYDREGAIELLLDYTDWEFWHPFNHARLSQLYAVAGDFEKAEASLAWAKGSQYYAHAKSVLDAARSGEG